MTSKSPKRACPAARRSAAIAVAITAACAGCGFGRGSAAAPSASTASPPVVLTPATTAPAPPPASSGPATTSPPASSSAPAAASCAQRAYGAMTPEQRVGQLFLVGVSSNAATADVARAVNDYHFGSVLLSKSGASVSTLKAGSAAIQALATQQATGGVRFLVAANQEGGEIQQLSGPGFGYMPSALSQGKLSPATLRDDAEQWGDQLKAAGVNLDLAPVMDVVPAATAASNGPIGAYDREFGYDPQTNGTHGVAFIQGMATAGVAATAKHFPGLGHVVGNTDFASGVTDTVTTGDSADLGSFKDAVAAGVRYVMIATALYTQIDARNLAAFSPAVIGGLLRQEMGFTGVVVSDDLGEAAQVASIPAGQRAVDFIDAGGDLVTSQDLGPAETMAATVLADASASAAFRSKVASAVMTVLAAKAAQGLLPC
ncbi:MAG TPA: glycoside hydrolase family 3 N-terminal domain-containing protein [Trebonia sp.]|nr:glycoside hydrolase family 3 N-terminal domain-containing protein [Trebonia sp.]